YYLVQQRDGLKGDAFRTIARVDKPEYTYTATDDAIHSFRIIAGNDGGVSFPSEVLAMRHAEGTPVVIVNGFTRICAPDWFDSGEIAGFYDARDHGVPYVQDISFIGSQFEFRRDIPWMDDDAAGFGASRANYEDRVVAGNTFDFVAVHGEAIAAAGRGFVSESVESFCSAPVLAGSTVDLILGKQKETAKGRGVYGTRYKAFPDALQQALRAHTAAGGDVLVSGACVATDIWDNPFSSKEVAEADKRFATEVLGYQWRVGQATVESGVYGVPTPFKAFTGGEWFFNNQLSEDCYAVESPDSFFAPDKEHGCTLMRYSENNLVAAIAFAPGKYRTVVLGFPFETVRGVHSRASMMRQVLDFFNSDNK
ncbi:MAG: xanthan lyase, partial [Muribaculaceae bacterium]|nr:xanthan lyase [Muribaculaceae bacterium]